MNNSIDIILIPPITNPVFSEDYDGFMPLGLLALSASLVKSGHTCKIFQPEGMLFSEDAYNTIRDKIISYNPSVVGFSTWCHSYPSSIIISKKIKEIIPDIVILFGGPQASLLSKETLMIFNHVDFILSGESDINIVSFLDELKKNKFDRNTTYITPSLSYKNVFKEVISNKCHSPIQNLDSLPIPHYELLDINSTSVSLDVGRGCPFRCTFCTTNNFFSKSYRVKSVNRIIKEMDFLWSSKKVNSFDFTHDMFTLNKDFITQLCLQLIKHENSFKRGYKWTCSARIDCVSDELLQLMKDSGCNGIFFGIETASKKMQKIIKKNICIDNVYTVITKCKQIGLSCSTSFIAGFPDETRDDLEKTLATILKIAFIGAKVQVSLLSLLPQTPLYEKHKDELILDNYNSDFSGGILGHLEKELIKEYPELFSSFYYLPIRSVSRETLIKINIIVNNIHKLNASLKILWPVIQRYLECDHISILAIIENKIDENEPLISLISILSSFINHHKNSLPDIISDIFTAEAAGIFVCKRYLTSQLIERKNNKETDINKIIEKNIIPTPHWTIIKTNYIVSDMVDGVRNNKFNKLKKKEAYTLVVPLNEREASYYNVKGWQLQILRNFTDIININILLNKCVKKDKTKDLLNFLIRLEKLDVIRITDEKKPQPIATSPFIYIEKRLFK